MNPRQRVVVTGIGMVTAIGNDEASFWSSLLAGRSGVRTVRNHDLSANPVKNGAEVDDAAIEGGLPHDFRRADPSLKFAYEASRQALAEAGRLSSQPQEIGSIWGCGTGQSEKLQAAYRIFFDKGPKGMRPSTVTTCMANSLASNLSISFQLTGPNYVITSACASASNAIGVAFRMISEGHSDAVLCGGADTPFNPFIYGTWTNIGVLSTDAEPGRALRPFAADRAGTLLGEGAGALLLESLEGASRRGARIRGEIVGYGESSDATHITRPSVVGQARAIRAALASAALDPKSVGYINAHGTGTVSNDATEALAIREAMGDATDGIPVGAMKSYFGHTLGASGAIEAIGALLALERRVAPPNLNLESPDPACPVHLIGSSPRAIATDYAIKNSFGFGGGNAVLVLRRHS
jgi:3-oxoacyl-[acyl-carrier-protein] synthase II